MKEFAVIGLGNFGATVAQELKKLKCQVTAIDSDETAVQSIQDDMVAIVADATRRAFLEKIEVEKFDCFVVSTGQDSHASILITLHLKELKAKRIIVKANSDDHARILTKVGASEAIIPEKQMAFRLANSMAQSNLLDFLPLTGDYFVVELKPPKNFIGKTLRELDVRARYNVQIIAVRDLEAGTFDHIPGGDYLITENDLLLVIGTNEDIEKMKD
ncbi:MAG: TrkA family potassium uptake protein [candidate division Zixibacteria bacterium]